MGEAGGELGGELFTLGANGRMVIVIGVIVIGALIWFGIPLLERFRRIIGTAAQPVIDEHNADTSAHTDIHSAILLIQRAQEDLQRQITAEVGNRKESLSAIDRRLDTAIRLLDRDKE